MIFIGLDIGSTAVKAMAIDDRGAVVARGKCAYPTEYADAIVTQRPEDWWQASAEAVRQVTSALDPKQRVAAISTSSQGGSILALDRDYRPLTPAMTWMDRRAPLQSEHIIAHFGNDEIYRSCGWRSTAGDCASKILWLSQQQPEIFERAAHYMTTEEYINYRLCGQSVTDPTGAAIMRLYDVNAAEWSSAMTEYLGIDAAALPRVAACGSEIGKLTPEAAEAMGLDTSVSVICGAHDQYCASIGSGMTRPGDLLLATGTAWVIFGLTQSLCFNECYIAPGIHPFGGFGAMATLSGVGAAVANHADAMGVALPELDRVAETRRLSAGELLCCPCPKGRSFLPHREGTLGGGTHGLTSAHDGYDLALALMEGAAFEVALAIERFAEAGMQSSSSLTMSGGAAASPLWRGIVKAVTGRDLLLTAEKDTPALGAAMIAALSQGAFDSPEACVSALGGRRADTAPPDPALRDHYAQKLELYRNWCIN